MLCFKKAVYWHAVFCPNIQRSFELFMRLDTSRTKPTERKKEAARAFDIKRHGLNLYPSQSDGIRELPDVI